MSILSSLISVRFLSEIKPNKFIFILGFIYFSFLMFETTIGTIIYLIICALTLALIIIAHARPKKLSTWDDDPRVKAAVEAQMNLIKQRKQKEKDNPYA